MNSNLKASILFFRSATFVTGLLLLSAQTIVQAQVPAPGWPASEASSESSQWALGIGAMYDRKSYRDFDNKVQPLPILMYENRSISFFGTALDVKLPSTGPLSLRMRARYSNEGYEAKDSPFLSGMEDRKSGVWVGGAAIWRGNIMNASAEALSATGDAEGKRFKLELDHSFNTGRLTVTPRISATWYDKKYVDYYYGVRANEVRIGRARYAGESTTNAELGVRIGYAIAQRHNVLVDLSVTKLGSTIKDSPLVDKSSENSVKFCYLYAF